jgi:uncharacterized protein (TIGR03435 family)
MAWLLVATTLIATTTVDVILAQSPQTQSPLAFDVASVKLVTGPLSSGGGPWTVGHGRFRADAAWVRAVIAVAYGIPAVQVHGGPQWVDRDRYDFDAKAETADAGLDSIRAMLQTLLADRFKLVTHRETHEIPLYALLLGKNGSKMQEAKEGRKNYINWTGLGQVTFTECNMLGLINILSFTIGSPVIDKTGLAGVYNFKLEFADPRFPRPASQTAVDPPPDIFAAVEEQLGLKLEASKSPAEILVIDNIERASEN